VGKSVGNPTVYTFPHRHAETKTMSGLSSQEVPSRPSQSRPVCILTSAWREVVDAPTVGEP
jgi:hypothetical protein